MRTVPCFFLLSCPSFLPTDMLSTPIIPASTFQSTSLTRTPIDADTIRFISQEQKDAVAKLVQDLTVGPKSLSQIKDHFVSEMKKGLSKDGETLAMVPTYVMGRLDGSGIVLLACSQRKVVCVWCAH